MKINAVILRKDKIKSIRHLSDNRNKQIFLTVYLSVFVLAGIILFIYLKEKSAGTVNLSFNEYIQFIKTESKPVVFMGLLSGNISFFVLIIFLSSNLFGKPLIYILCALKISALSFVVTYLYNTFQIKGIEYALLVLLPGKLLLILAIILSITLASDFIDEFIRRKSESKAVFSNSIIKLLFVFSIILLSTAIDTITAVSFSALFQL